MPGAVVIRSSKLLAITTGAASTRTQIAVTARWPRTLHPSLHAATVPRLVAVRVSSIDTTPEPEKPAGEQTQGPLHAVGQLGECAFKLVIDAWNLVKVRSI